MQVAGSISLTFGGSANVTRTSPFSTRFLAPDATLMAVQIRRTSTTLSADAPVTLFKTRRVGGGVNVIGYGHQYDVAPDGRFLINVEPESNPRPITLVMNWKPPAR